MNLQEKVKKVNEILDSYGSIAIQKDDSKSFKSIGYRPQYLIDAMNEVFGQGNWRHNVLDVDIVESTYTSGGNNKTRTAVTVKLNIHFLNEGKIVFETGTHVGGAFVLSGNIADAIKSAITDGIGKSLSLLSVGNKAYRGELEVGKNSPTIKAPENTGNFTSKPKVNTVSDTSEKISNSRFKPKSTGGGFRKPAKKLSNVAPATLPEESPAATVEEPEVVSPSSGGNGSFAARFGNVANESAVASFSDSGLTNNEENGVNGNN